ncbi:MAG: 2-phospho-L-lactate transferase [Rhizobiaceae bacterium]|nr:2-phospho-L-lactate transferase [Hyphomicrobiales bacterium]NRB29458.1 2-phospho-L-lactate transferase [Rhizobiaceae bacterium]
MSGARTKVTLLAGGVGGAKMAEGLAALDDVDLSIIGNIADDDEFHGLWVSPDIDTLTYTLAGLINREQGWGVADESTRALDTLNVLGRETWMTLGDRDFGLHIYRTNRRRLGDRPSDIAHDVAQRFGVKPRILLPSDDVVQTRVKTDAGWISFQEYFVREQCQPEISGLDYVGLEAAKVTDEAAEAIGGADLIVLAPSNPLVSIDPILKIDGIRGRVIAADAPVFAVSPLIAGKVVKGPADRMMTALGLRADAVGIAEHYSGLVDRLYIDHADAALTSQIEQNDMSCAVAPIVMKDLDDKARLARQLLDDFGARSQERAA